MLYNQMVKQVLRMLKCLSIINKSKTVKIKAIKQIDTGEEILICYGPKFKLK